MKQPWKLFNKTSQTCSIYCNTNVKEYYENITDHRSAPHHCRHDICRGGYLGTLFLARLSIDLLRRIEMNTVMVITTYNGASAEDMETNITRVLENGLSTVSDVKDKFLPPKTKSFHRVARI